MRASCGTFSSFTARRWTLVTTLPFPRNEGVPGSSPGVGFVVKGPRDAGLFVVPAGSSSTVDVRSANELQTRRTQRRDAPYASTILSASSGPATQRSLCAWMT